MSETPSAAPLAPGPTYVVCDPKGTEAAGVHALLRARGIERAEWVRPGDIADLDVALSAGAAATVIFMTAAVFLEALWDERIDFDQWVSGSVAVEFASPPPSSPDQALRFFIATWQTWQRRQRRRRAIAGLILSTVAVAAAFVLFWLRR